MSVSAPLFRYCVSCATVSIHLSVAVIGRTPPCSLRSSSHAPLAVPLLSTIILEADFPRAWPTQGIYQSTRGSHVVRSGLCWCRGLLSFVCCCLPSAVSETTAVFRPPTAPPWSSVTRLSVAACRVSSDVCRAGQLSPSVAIRLSAVVLPSAVCRLLPLVVCRRFSVAVYCMLPSVVCCRRLSAVCCCLLYVAVCRLLPAVSTRLPSVAGTRLSPLVCHRPPQLARSTAAGRRWGQVMARFEAVRRGRPSGADERDWSHCESAALGTPRRLRSPASIHCRSLAANQL